LSCAIGGCEDDDDDVGDDGDDDVGIAFVIISKADSNCCKASLNLLRENWSTPILFRAMTSREGLMGASFVWSVSPSLSKFVCTAVVGE